MPMEIAISYQGTVLIAILVNIAIGDVKGMYEQICISRLSTLPLLIENITTIKPITNRKVTG